MSLKTVLGTLFVLFVAIACDAEPESPSPEGEPASSPEGGPEGEPESELPPTCASETRDASGTLIRSTVTTIVDNKIVGSETTHVGGGTNATTFSFDGDGLLESFAFDVDNDGVDEQIVFYTYNAAAFLVRLETDIDVDGTINAVTRYTRDGLGHAVGVESDFDNDGVVDSVSTSTFEVDGLVTVESLDIGDDGSIDTRITVTVDAEERQLEIENVDLVGPNGTQVNAYAYRADGRLSTATYIKDGVTEQVTSYEYDCD